MMVGPGKLMVGNRPSRPGSGYATACIVNIIKCPEAIRYGHARLAASGIMTYRPYIRSYYTYCLYEITYKIITTLYSYLQVVCSRNTFAVGIQDTPLSAWASHRYIH